MKVMMMNKKISLLAFSTIIFFTNGSLAKDTNNELSHAEKILIELYREKEKSAEQSTQEIVKSTKENHKLVAKQEATIGNYEKSLYILKTKLNKSINKFDTTINNTNEIIAYQNELIKKYHKKNIISWCALTALASSAITFLIMEKIKEETSISGLWNRFAVAPFSKVCNKYFKKSASASEKVENNS